jgi:hypothetical protein
MQLFSFRYYLSESPIFPVATWNKHQSILEGLAITNNVCEVFLYIYNDLYTYYQCCGSVP